MRLLLMTPQAAALTDQAEADTLILSVRGYDVCSFSHAVQSMYSGSALSISRSDRIRVLALEIIHGMLVVLHPMLSGDERAEILGLTKLLGGRAVEMDDLPFLPPAHFAEWADAHRVRPSVGAISTSDTTDGHVPPVPSTGAQRMRERLLRLIEPLRRWAQRFDAYLGDSMKNPMTREAMRRRKAAPRVYRCDNAPTTTG